MILKIAHLLLMIVFVIVSFKCLHKQLKELKKHIDNDENF